MKILQLIQKPQLRGAEVFATQLSNQLLELGHDCKMVSIFPGDASLSFRGELDALNRPPQKRFYDREGWKLLADIVRAQKPDVVQANAGDTLKFAAFSKLFFGWESPLIFRNANKISDFLDSRTKFWLNKFFVSRTSHVISVSNLCRLDFMKTFQYPSNRIDTVQIGIDLLPPGQPADDVLKIADRGPVLLNVGSLVKEKNHEGLLRIFAATIRKTPNLQLIIVGKGSLLPALKERARQLQIESQVHFLGYRQDVLAIIQAARAFLLPSHIEGLPAVILEAQYCKTPVVAYNVGGISEIVKNDSTGWLVEKNDEDGFVQKLQDVFTGKNTITEVVDRAHRQVVQHYDNKEIARRFLEVYCQVISIQSKL